MPVQGRHLLNSDDSSLQKGLAASGGGWEPPAARIALGSARN